MNSRAVITIAYDGPAIPGTMDVKELAPALFDMGQLLEEANRILNGEDRKVNVLVKADFHAGSFEVCLELIQSIVDAAKGLLDLQQSGVSASDILRILGFASAGVGGALGLLRLVKWLRGRGVSNIVAIQNGNSLVYVEGDIEPVEVLGKAIPLFQDVNVRQALRGVTRPLEREGIDRFIVREQNRDVEVVERAESGYFDVPDMPREEIVDTEYTFAYTIVTTSFDERLKWRLSDGENRITALMKDESFLRRIDEGVISFAKGDVFRARMQLRQWRDADGLKSEYCILEVLDHIRRRPYQQLHLPESEEMDTDDDE